MPQPPTTRRPRSTFQRAVLPVLGGIGFFILLGLATWGVAALLSRNPENVNDRLAKTTYEVGNSARLAEVIAESGPLIFPDLGRGDQEGTRTIVLDHTGDDPRANWRAFYAYPADRAVACKVTQIRGTREFTDCDGRRVDVEQLMPPEGVVVRVGETITIDLTAATAAADDTVATTGTDVTVSTSDAP